MRDIESTIKGGSPAGSGGDRRARPGTSLASRSGWAHLGRQLWKYRFFHLLVLPGFLYYVIFHYLPMVGVVIAFTDYRGMGGIHGILTAPWVGFKNFVDLFQSHFFWRLLRNSLILSGLRLFFGFPAPIILALLVNEVRMRKVQRVVQTITYLPHFLSWVVIAGLVSMLLTSTGPVNAALVSLFHIEPILFLSDPKYFRGVLVTSGIWQSIGWNSIIYFAAIAGVPQEQYEVAIVEGASRGQRAWYVTLPWMRFVIVILLVLSIGSIIESDFEQIFNLYNPAVYEVSDVFDTYVYRRGLQDRDFSYATAVGLFKSVVSFGLVMV
ncbi:MAG TPA: ABC transporter permease subunit, partial [Spirochaetia bacterium]|nr:ABC transporter permease subunit [Spirochaetia bacterium]